MKALAAVALVALVVPAGAPAQERAGGSSLESGIQSVASLAGEPRRIAAGAMVGDDDRMVTLEDGSTAERGSRRRVVIVPSLDATAATSTAILDAVRWFKTTAPADVRRQWSLSALLTADKSAAPRLARWIAFQAPDLVVEVGASSPTWSAIFTQDATAGLGDVPVTTASLESALRSNATSTSPLRKALDARIAREPLAIARLLAAKYPQAPSMSYIPAASWVGMVRLSALTRDPQWAARAREQAQPWLTGERSLFGQRIQLTAVAGTIAFAELARAQGTSPSDGSTEAARRLAVEGATRATGRNANGLAEYGGGWTDDMFMATSVLARTASLEGRASDLDAAARLLVDYAARLQREDGLFIHNTEMPVAWGRGNGFAAVALAEALTALPANHPQRAAVLAIYRRQMTALLGAQSPDGAWTNVIDEPGSYRESSGTAMIFIALARGIRLGWLDRQHLPAAQRAWTAVAARITEDGGIVDVCESTPGGATKRYYLDRRPITGADDRGGAMALLAALERHELGR